MTALFGCGRIEVNFDGCRNFPGEGAIDRIHQRQLRGDRATPIHINFVLVGGIGIDGGAGCGVLKVPVSRSGDGVRVLGVNVIERSLREAPQEGRKTKAGQRRPHDQLLLYRV